MKIYNIEYSANTPLIKRISVNTGSDWIVGVKVKKNGRDIDLLSGDIKLVDGSTDITPKKIEDDIAYFSLSSDRDPGDKIYKVDVSKDFHAQYQTNVTAEPGVAQSLTLSVDLTPIAGTVLHKEDFVYVKGPIAFWIGKPSESTGSKALKSIQKKTEGWIFLQRETKSSPFQKVDTLTIEEGEIIRGSLTMGRDSYDEVKTGYLDLHIGQTLSSKFDLIVSETDTGVNTGKCESSGGGSEYVLPEATTDALGGVKILEYQACDTPGAFMLYGDTSYSGITTDDDGYAKLVHLTKVLTQAEYDAQGYINPDTIFFITD